MGHALQRAHHAGGLVHDDDGAGSQHGARLRDRVVVHGELHHDAPRQHFGRRPAGDYRFHPVAVAHAARELQQLGERNAERDFIITGPIHVTGYRENLHAAVVRSSELEKVLGAVAQDVRHRRQRLGVVDRGRPPEQAVVRRKRRLVARQSALALDRLEHGRFLPADVGAGAEIGVEVEIDARAEDVFAEQSGAIGFFKRRLETFVRLDELAAQIVVADGRAHGVSRDRHAFDDEVRVVAQNVAVLEGSRLAFVGVAHQVFLPRGLRIHEAPFHAGRETGAAAAAQRRGFQLLDDARRIRPLAQHLLPHFVAAGAAIARQQPRLLQGGIGQTDAVHQGRHG